MWRYPEIRVQTDISNIFYVSFLAPIVIKVNVYVCTSCQVDVLANKSGKMNINKELVSIKIKPVLSFGSVLSVLGHGYTITHIADRPDQLCMVHS